MRGEKLSNQKPTEDRRKKGKVLEKTTRGGNNTEGGGSQRLRPSTALKEKIPLGNTIPTKEGSFGKAIEEDGTTELFEKDHGIIIIKRCLKICEDDNSSKNEKLQKEKNRKVKKEHIGTTLRRNGGAPRGVRRTGDKDEEVGLPIKTLNKKKKIY